MKSHHLNDKSQCCHIVVAQETGFMSLKRKLSVKY